MRLTVRLAVYFYMTLFLFLIIIAGLFVLQIVPFRDVIVALHKIYYIPEKRIIVGAIALGLLLINHTFVKIISGGHQKGKTIAFNNPSGLVSVSLTAMEDLIRRLVAKMPEVKDVRSAMSYSARRKRLEVDCRLMLNTDSNIPEMTAQLQELIKRKIQDTIGLEETVIVRVDVVKIIAGNTKIKRTRKDDETEDVSTPIVPFKGYRA